MKLSMVERVAVLLLHLPSSELPSSAITQEEAHRKGDTRLQKIDRLHQEKIRVEEQEMKLPMVERAMMVSLLQFPCSEQAGEEDIPEFGDIARLLHNTEFQTRNLFLRHHIHRCGR